MPREGFVEGPQWPQGVHSLLALQGVPAVALGSKNAFFITSTVAHTPKDLPELVDPEEVAAVSRFFAEVVGRLS
jgi:aminopeptidase YwaD